MVSVDERVMGFDVYSMASTGNVAKTLTSAATDTDHTPVVVFVPYGSRLGFHENSVASTMANIDYKFPQCVCFPKEEKERTCYTMNERQISMMVRKNKANTIAATDYKGVQILCYEENNESENL